MYDHIENRPTQLMLDDIHRLVGNHLATKTTKRAVVKRKWTHYKYLMRSKLYTMKDNTMKALKHFVRWYTSKADLKEYVNYDTFKAIDKPMVICFRDTIHSTDITRVLYPNGLSFYSYDNYFTNLKDFYTQKRRATGFTLSCFTRNTLENTIESMKSNDGQRWKVTRYYPYVGTPHKYYKERTKEGFDHE